MIETTKKASNLFLCNHNKESTRLSAAPYVHVPIISSCLLLRKKHKGLDYHISTFFLMTVCLSENTQGLPGGIIYRYYRREGQNSARQTSTISLWDWPAVLIKPFTWINRLSKIKPERKKKKFTKLVGIISFSFSLCFITSYRTPLSLSSFFFRICSWGLLCLALSSRFVILLKLEVAPRIAEGVHGFTLLSPFLSAFSMPLPPCFLYSCGLDSVTVLDSFLPTAIFVPVVPTARPWLVFLIMLCPKQLVCASIL